jgi:hypothetical protein
MASKDDGTKKSSLDRRSVLLGSTTLAAASVLFGVQF